MNIKECVIDFCVTGPNLDHVEVIELNPFLFSSDSALFSWANDQKVLEHGPFEFRVRKNALSTSMILGSLTHDWRSILTSL